MQDPNSRPHPVKAVVCPYHWIIIPARNGTSRRAKGASFQNSNVENVCISERFTALPYASTGICRADMFCVVHEEQGKNKTTHSILKRTRLMANKIKQVVSGKELGWCQKKKFPQVFVENKGLEEICRRVFTGILDS
jgi:hypothetical protein